MICKGGIRVKPLDNSMTAKAAICIPTNMSLTVRGLDAQGRTAATAGIEVPPRTQLIIFGDGTLEATGGNGASGANGGKGKQYYHSGDIGWAGDYAGGLGGDGGDGGGGGGAGIGGSGGAGGQGGKFANGEKGSAVKYAGYGKRNEFYANGRDGIWAKDDDIDGPHRGGDAGTVYVLGPVKVKAQRGSRGASGGAGGSRYRDTHDCPGNAHIPGGAVYRCYYGGGAGGGGGGAGAAAQYDIGGGGGGGSGGGSGGCGGLYYAGCWVIGKHGEGGRGAKEGGNFHAPDGGQGENMDNQVDGWKTWQVPGTLHWEQCTYFCKMEKGHEVKGGQGGQTQNQGVDPGGFAALYKSEKAELTGTSPGLRQRETHEDLIFVYTPDGGEKQRCLYGEVPRFSVAKPMKDGYLFMGYFATLEDGREEIEYDCTGRPMREYLHTKDVSLHPKFVKSSDFRPTGVSVNGVDAAFEYGPGWEYSPGTRTITLMTRGDKSIENEFAISGSNVVGTVRQIVLKGNGTVRLSDLTLVSPETETQGLPAGEGVLQIVGGLTNVVVELVGSNTLARTRGAGSGLVCGGTVTVREAAGSSGGILVAAGAGTRPGIGVTGGRLTVEGGRILAYGGAAGGFGLSGGTNYWQTGGTVLLSGGDKNDLDGGAATVTGGSLCLAHRTRSHSPTDGANVLYCIRTAVPESPGDDVRVVVSNAVGAMGYGTQGIYPIDGRIYLWRPNGYYEFDVDGARAFATVKNADTNAYYVLTGVTIDGENVGMGLGDGWRWRPANSNLVFRSGYTNQMTVSGIDTNGSIHPIVSFDTRLRFSDLSLFGWGVKDGVVDVTGGTLSLTLAGKNVLAGLDGFRGNGLAVYPNAALTVDGDGSLSATGGVWGAGIGGVWGTGLDGEASRAGPIDIRSGTVTAVGGFEGAGIGGASGVSGGDVTVADGARVTASGGFGAAGVGGGAWSDGGGALRGSVTATGGAHAPPTGAGTSDCERKTTATAERRAGSLTVTALSDAALRAAVAAANAAGGGEITFADGVSGTLTLSGRLVVDAAGEVTIDGGGRIRLTGGSAASDGGGAILATRGALVLRGLAFADFATSGCGGAVRAEKGLSAEDCTFSGCRADEYGGAVFVGKEAAADFVGCRFTGNAAGLSGGAVYARKRLTATRCAFDGNRAAHGGAAVGAFAPNNWTVAEHCSFLGNVGARRGGGLDAAAGHAVAAACTLTRNAGGGLYAADRLTAASTLSTDNETRLWCCPPDAEIGLHASEFRSHRSSFGKVAAGDFTETVYGLRPNEPFQTDGAVFTKAVGPVQQVYRKLTHRNKRIVQGCAVWHTPGWETAAVSSSVNPSAAKTSLYGHSEANDLCAADQLGTPLTTTNLLVGAVTEASERESLVVTTADDVVNPEDERTSLREAIVHTSSVDMPLRLDGYREITVDRALFGTDGALTLTATCGTFRIDGGRWTAINGEPDGCALRLAGGGADALFAVVATNALMVENLTVAGAAADSAGAFAAYNVRFEGAPAARASVRSSGAGQLAFERCTFFGNGGGCADVADRTVGHAVCCTVVSNGTSGADWLFRIAPDAQFDFANCTLADNPRVGAAIETRSKEGTCLVNCVLTANGSRDLVTDGAGKFLGACTSYRTATAKPEDMWDTTWDGLKPGDAFDGPVRTTFRYGVRQAYYRQRRDGSIRCTGAYVFHSDDWQSLAFGFYRTGDQRRALRGGSDRANYVVAADVVGRPIVQGYVSRGSYATCCDEEYFDDGEILVNTSKDFPEHLTEHDYDGLVTLREAVDFACSHPEFRDRLGDCTVRFADRFLAGRSSNAVTLVRAQIDVPAGVFADGTLRILGRTDGGVAVDGAGSYRIWRTGATNQVEFANLTFRNGIGVAADWTHTCGGALYNLGRTRAVNCVFGDCFAGWPSPTSAGLAGRASGGAVYTGEGGNTVLERCTLRNCVAGYGGALFTAGGGATTALATTFAGNRAAEGVLVLAPYGGAIVSDGRARTSLVNCTVTGNVSDGTVGGICALGASGDYTLYLLSSIVTGNRASEPGRSDADLSCSGKAKVCRTAYGQRGVQNLDATWEDTESKGGVAPEDIFATTTDEGAAVGRDLLCDGVVQTVFPAHGSRLLDGAYVRFVTNDVWHDAAAWHGTVVSGRAGKTFWGDEALARRALSGDFFAVDQLKTPMTVATVGSTVLTDPSYVAFSHADGTVELFASRDAAVDAANAAVTHEPWYTPIESGDTVRLVLNAQATPVIGAAVDFGAADASTVSVWLEKDTVKPGLWYGLGRSDTPVGPFVVEDGAWVRADADGALHEALTAPKTGPQGFYRVIVR